MPAVKFTFDLWRAGSLTEIGIKQREWNIKLRKNKIKELAVGFAEGYKLNVRPKNDCVAVMFFYEDRHFWTHLTIKEFLICFPELEKYLQNIKN
jgi:hypothetical protein